jgi:arylsulfatase A-like enzyme
MAASGTHAFGTLPTRCIGSCQTLSARNSATSRPNIIFIMLDEWGYYELSCLGHPKICTPAIDRMVAEGLRFTQALAGGPVCAPTRSCLLTGQHSGHTTVRANGGWTPLRANEITIATMLKAAGYATGGFGKWGCGARGTSGVPEEHGFDVFFGYYDQVHAHTYFPRYLIRNSAQVPLPGNTGDYYEGKTYAQHMIFEESLKFIEKNANRPFFAYLPWIPPHGHWGIPADEPAWAEFEEKPWTAGQRTPNDAKVYAAMLLMVDRQIGRIFDLLKRLGIHENTIVFVCGDNGGQDYFHQQGTYRRGFFQPNVDPRTGIEFRGQKGSLYEGGLRVPMVVRWPGKIAPGTVSDHLWYFPDVMPTLADIAGIQPPPTTDGLSILPKLTGTGRQKQHEYLYWEYQQQVAVRIGSYKGVHRKPELDWGLYDLSTDVSERHDIAAQHQNVVARMARVASAAHTPPQPGEVHDQTLLRKDRKEGSGRP